MSKEVALITGGTGCVGYHIISQLLSHPSFSPPSPFPSSPPSTTPNIHVLTRSRSPTKNLHPRVTYHTGSTTSTPTISALFAQVKPTVIFHVASPPSEGSTQGYKYFHDANVVGTEVLLREARGCGGTWGFVYTSSVSVYQFEGGGGKGGGFVGEEWPVMRGVGGGGVFNYYSTTKAIAERAVLGGNDRGEGEGEGEGEGRLLTCALRIAPVYGERDNQMIPNLLKSLSIGLNKIRFASDAVKMDVVSPNNAARAHILAYEALHRTQLSLTTSASSSVSTPISEDRKVDGEAFNITNGTPMTPWSVFRKVWKAAGDETPKSEVWYVPVWLLVGIGMVLEWIVWGVTGGSRTPSDLRSHAFRWINEERTFGIGEARERLGYEPVDDIDESIERGVAWALKENEDVKKKKL